MTSPLTSHPFWRFVVEHTTDEDLVEISLSDAGIDSDLNLRELHRLCRCITEDFVMQWNPLEALRLSRWSTLDSTRSHHDILRTQRERLFSAAALLVGRMDPKNVNIDQCCADDLIIVWDAAHALYPEVANLWLSFIDAFESCVNDDERNVIACMRCIVAMDPHIADMELARLNAHRALSETIQHHQGSCRRWISSAPWDFLLTSFPGSLMCDTWRSHLDRTLDNAQRGGHTALTHDLLQLRGGIAP